jgi:hypothetical protein
MPLDKPITLGPNLYYFHGDLWTAAQLREQWGILVGSGQPDSEKEEAAEADGREPILRA